MNGAAGERGGAPLTARETEVARLVAEGRTNAQIAAELRLTPRGAASHVEAIFRRLGLRSRGQIAGWVVEQRLLRAPDRSDRTADPR